MRAKPMNGTRSFIISAPLNMLDMGDARFSESAENELQLTTY